MSVYHNIFAEAGWRGGEPGWKRVQEEFDTDAPEPFKVLFADYSYANYDGCAFVLWQEADGRFGYVLGCHCSCFGLEGQWQPEIHTADEVRALLERGHWHLSNHKALIEPLLP